MAVSSTCSSTVREAALQVAGANAALDVNPVSDAHLTLAWLSTSKQGRTATQQIVQDCDNAHLRGLLVEHLCFLMLPALITLNDDTPAFKCICCCCQSATLSLCNMNPQ
jgi:hypothetical protein